jgi:hypothetical protein
MAALGGLFGGHKQGKHPHFDQIAEAIHRNFALALAPASSEVMAVLDRLTPREALDFDNAHSIEGLQELFKVRSIRTTVDPQTRAMGLSLMAAGQVEEELKAEHTHVRTMHMSEDHGARPIIKPAASAPILGVRPAIVAAAGGAIAPLPPSFEHLPSVEALCSDIVDVFVRYGQLNSGDKDVLRKIRPTGTTVEARIIALERWQAELRRRMRAIAIPKAPPRLALGAKTGEQAKGEEQLANRFAVLIAWLARLIKEFETTGIKYRNKPVWLR